MTSLVPKIEVLKDALQYWLFGLGLPFVCQFSAVLLHALWVSPLK